MANMINKTYNLKGFDEAMWKLIWRVLNFWQKETEGIVRKQYVMNKTDNLRALCFENNKTILLG